MRKRFEFEFEHSQPLLLAPDDDHQHDDRTTTTEKIGSHKNIACPALHLCLLTG